MNRALAAQNLAAQIASEAPSAPRVLEALTARDKFFLARGAKEPLDLEVFLNDLLEIVWLVHFELMTTKVDEADRIFACTTLKGLAALEKPGVGGEHRLLRKE